MQIIRWPEQVSPRQEELLQKMIGEGLSPYSWSNAPGDTYSAHRHNYEKVLYCVSGSIRFILPDRINASGIAEYIDLLPGDLMILPPGICHSARVGAHGVTCLEAAR